MTYFFLQPLSLHLDSAGHEHQSIACVKSPQPRSGLICLRPRASWRRTTSQLDMEPNGKELQAAEKARSQRENVMEMAKRWLRFCTLRCCPGNTRWMSVTLELKKKKYGGDSISGMSECPLLSAFPSQSKKKCGVQAQFMGLLRQDHSPERKTWQRQEDD